MKLLFQIDINNPVEDLLEDRESQDTLEKLLDMVDNGNINEAENQVYPGFSELT